jgi:FAD-dependent sensor of blue light
VPHEAWGRRAQYWRITIGILSMSKSQLDLVHCVYCSASTKAALSSTELESLLEECRQSNSTAGITGILLYQNGSFLQVLEGEQLGVEALFHKIGLDKRHHHTKKIIFEPIAKRSFAAWTMGFPKITSKELATIPGLNDFFHHGTSYVELGEGRAKSLLAAFKDGKWRASLS